MWGKKRHSFKKLLRGDWLQGAHTFYVCCYPEQISLHIILWLCTSVATFKEDGHYVVALYNFKPCMLCPLGTEVAGLVTLRLAHRQFSHILHPRALSERYGGAAGKIRHHFYSRPFHNTSPHPDRERSIRSILYSLEFSRVNWLQPWFGIHGCHKF